MTCVYCHVDLQEMKHDCLMSPFDFEETVCCSGGEN